MFCVVNKLLNTKVVKRTNPSVYSMVGDGKPLRMRRWTIAPRGRLGEVYSSFLGRVSTAQSVSKLNLQTSSPISINFFLKTGHLDLWSVLTNQTMIDRKQSELI